MPALGGLIPKPNSESPNGLPLATLQSSPAPNPNPPSQPVAQTHASEEKLAPSTTNDAPSYKANCNDVQQEVDDDPADRDTDNRFLGQNRLFWMVVLGGVAIFAIVQCTWVAFRYYKQETGTKLAYLERKDRDEIVSLVQLVYCPQDWLNTSAIESDPSVDPGDVAYAISLIPYLDFYALKHLQLVWDPEPSIKLKVEYSGTDIDWTNGEAIFLDQSATSENMWKRLRTAMASRDVVTLVDFLAPYANRMADNTASHLRFTLRYGRMCEVVRTNRVDYLNNGVDKPQKVQLDFVHPGLVENLPRPHVFYSLHDYPAIAPVNDAGMTQWPSSVVLGPEENTTFTYTDSRSHLHVYYNQQFQMTYRRRHRFNKRSRPCRGEPGYRYPEDYLMWQCNLACSDRAFQAAGQKCSELTTISGQEPEAGVRIGSGKRRRRVDSNSDDRPCSSATFQGSREAFGAALYANPIFLDKSSVIEYEMTECRNAHKCNQLIECDEWRFVLSDTDQKERSKESESQSEGRTSSVSGSGQLDVIMKMGQGFASSYQNHTEPFRHTLWFTVEEGMSVIEYPLLTSDGCLGELGGIISLFLGASILTCLDWSFKTGEYLYLKSTRDKDQKKGS